MNPEYVGALAESIGAAAVVISLLYVARQVRQGSQQARLMTVHEANAQFHSIMQLTAASADSARIWGTGLLRGMSSLDANEVMLFGQLVGLLMSSYEDVFQYHREGLIDGEKMREIERPYLGVLACPGFSDYWALYGHLMADDFHRHIELRMAEARSTMDLQALDRLAGGDESGADGGTGTN